MSDVVIQVENLSKLYRLGLREEIHNTLAANMWSWIKAPVRNYKRLRSLNTFGIEEDADDLLWAIKDVSFEILSVFIFYPVLTLANPKVCMQFNENPENVDIAFNLAWDAIKF